MITVSQATIERICSDIRTGASDEFVKQFFASRPDWQEETEEKPKDKQEGTAKA